MSNYSYPKTKEEYWDTVDRYWEDLYDILVRYLPKEDLAKADHYRLEKNPAVSKLFNDAWWNAPDHRSIHSIPSWHVLCDLCSESYLVYEGEEGQEDE
ncbi:MAG: hypothetical protein AB7I18_13960 [Candidatus Berkiella sp.]